MRVVALVPAYNEEERIASTVRAILDGHLAQDVIVIDDGSTDTTAQEAATAGARVISLADNEGKGAALDAGLAAVDDEWDVLLMLDGDLGESAAQAHLLLEPVVAGKVDMTIARFPRPEGKAGFGLVKNAARRGIRDLGDASFDAQAPSPASER